jgi:hypothetical protein
MKNKELDQLIAMLPEKLEFGKKSPITENKTPEQRKKESQDLFSEIDIWIKQNENN